MRPSPAVAPVLLVLSGLLAPDRGLEAQLRWTAQLSKDEVTDAAHYLLSLPASGTTPGPLGAPYRPTLFLRCISGRLDAIFVDVGVVLDHGGVLVRWDSLPAVSQAWGRSDSYQAAFTPVPDSTLYQLHIHRQLLLRFYPSGGVYQTARFRLPALTPHLAGILRHCGRDLAAEDRAAATARRLFMEGVGTVSLRPGTPDTIATSLGEGVPLRPLVQARNRNGRPTTTFGLGALVTYWSGEAEFSYTTVGDTLSLGSAGVYRVAIQADGVHSPTTFMLIIRDTLPPPPAE